MKSVSPTDATHAPPAGRLRLTSEGLAWFAAALVLGGIGWLKSLNLLLLLAYVMAAVLVLNGVLARAHARRVRVKRPPLPPVYAGEEVRVGLTVHNAGTQPATVEVTNGNTTWHLDRLAGGPEAECTENRRFPRRGRVRTDGAWLWSGFPFGFLRHDVPADAADEVVVLPAVGEADAEGLRRWLLRQAGGEGGSRKVLRRVTTTPADVRGVRPYRPGDSLRAVHWRSSARRGELMVREYDAAPSPELVVVVEPWLPAAPTAADCANLEAALSLAATIVRAWCRSVGTRVSVVVAGATTTATTGPATEAFAREAVVPLAGVEGSSTFAPIPPSTFGRTLGRSARVVVSSRPTSPLATSLSRSTGKSFSTLGPSVPMPWYQPPAVGPMSGGL